MVRSNMCSQFCIVYFCVQELTRALGQVRLHVFIQCYTLVFIPIAMTLVVYSLKFTAIVDEVFLKGYVKTMTCLLV